MIEQWKLSLDNSGFARGILMDLSKAFDTINHKLLIAKLHAYGFSVEALELILIYLSNHWQRNKINVSFSSWATTLRSTTGISIRPASFQYLSKLFIL